MPRYPLLLPLISLLLGCARYEYEITAPGELAQHIGKSPVELQLNQLQYRMQTVDNYLVMRIYNRSNDLVQLLSESYVIDPHGESHPIDAQSMPPESHVKLVFPPLRAHLVPTGPSIGIGIGASSSSGRHSQRYGYGGVHDHPRYYAVYEPGKYWKWKGESQIQFGLMYKRGEERFTHQFTIRRRKM